MQVRMALLLYNVRTREVVPRRTIGRPKNSVARPPSTTILPTLAIAGSVDGNTSYNIHTYIHSFH
jgi:hypothetical protein